MMEDMTDDEILEAADGGIDKATGRKYYRNRFGDKVFDTYKKANRVALIVAMLFALFGGLVFLFPQNGGNFALGVILFGVPALFVWLCVWGWNLRTADSWLAGVNREKNIRSRIEDRLPPRSQPLPDPMPSNPL